MKEIKAIIRDYMVDHVIDALEQLREPPGITVTPVRGVGHTVRPESPDRLIAGAKLEMVVPDDRVEEIVGIVASKSHTGRSGDGIVFVLDVERAVRVRTGKEDDDAVR
ncbi:MAG: P-II family nitrogen regulator [Verrucomicrobiae bacterium]|jgi:nitrogen regulatory protein P-II 1|nr:P-II family nitrogen regulator [Verrucomicrobiae bacterium]